MRVNGVVATVRCAAKSGACGAAAARDQGRHRNCWCREVGALYKDDAALADMAQHAYEIDQVSDETLFFAGVVALVPGMVLQLLGVWPDAALHRHYPPVARGANGPLSRFAETRRTQSSSPPVVSVLISSSNSLGSVGQSPRSSRRSLLMALTQSRPAIGPST